MEFGGLQILERRKCSKFHPQKGPELNQRAVRLVSENIIERVFLEHISEHIKDQKGKLCLIHWVGPEDEMAGFVDERR